MNQTVKRIVDILFQDTVENDETRALHEELMNNCQEHYQDLISRGLSEDEAVAEVVESLKGMKDVIGQYPKKTSGPSSFSEDQEEDEGKCFVFNGADMLKVETKDQDITVNPSADGAIHVWCDDAAGVKAELVDGEVRVTGQKSEKVSAAFQFPEGEEVSISGILNMVGKAIRNMVPNIQGGPPITIEVPDGQMKEIELNSRSGDIECCCAMARKMTVRSTSGDVTLQPETEKTAEKMIVSTVSGEAEVHGSALEAEVSSMSGDVTVDGVFETLEMKSTSGEVEFNGSVMEVNASAISGDVSLTIENTTVKQIAGKSTSGDVEIYLPRGLRSVHAECATVSGDCCSRVSDAGMNAEVQIRAKSISGDVTVE
ncbi:DUF4097 family beta strand repeat-containing protein [Aristaeella lactis]|uniref:Adhesin n=1 Tax=Aristaeella lactis TaxID=3046383 RepID=A0AC61PPW9_9FIRM|nr:DUF4097 family beta strand repeat-containing protein [Aristaeella lactis]QUA54238.1 DUF4097 family beta strand repeat protein [Aristaeella lactis]SMC88183.1 Putative adhesin [Aristaeella lactis]